MRRAQRRARVDRLRARAIAAGRKVPPRRVRRRFSVARINAALPRATSIRDAARRLGCAHTTISRHTSPAVQEALRRRGLRWTPAKLLPGVDRDIVLARSRGSSARRIAGGLSLDMRDVRKVLREAGMGTPRRGPARPKRCPGVRMDVVTRREEPCDRMLLSMGIENVPLFRVGKEWAEGAGRTTDAPALGRRTAPGGSGKMFDLLQHSRPSATEGQQGSGQVANATDPIIGRSAGKRTAAYCGKEDQRQQTANPDEEVANRLHAPDDCRLSWFLDAAVRTGLCRIRNLSLTFVTLFETHKMPLRITGRNPLGRRESRPGAGPSRFLPCTHLPSIHNRLERI